MQNLLKALEEVRACAAIEDDRKASLILRELEGLVLMIDQWPDEFVEAIVHLLQDESFLSARSSWKLLRFLDTHWEHLTTDQRDRTRSVIATSFDKYADPTGPFVGSEILGEKFADRQALDALISLARTARMPARALVAHGLELFALRASDESLRPIAVNTLHELSSSDVDDVRKEAVISLRRLGIT